MDINEGKEILTTALIKKELLKLQMWDSIRLLIGIPLLSLIIWWLSKLFVNTTLYPAASIIAVILIVVCVLASAHDIIFFTYKLAKEQFTIKKAVLYKKEESKGSMGHGRDVPPRLFFDRGGYYNVSDYRYYVWSHAYCMFPHELFETSRIDDHFTLVILGKNIIMVYNDKFFDTSAIQYSE